MTRLKLHTVTMMYHKMSVSGGGLELRGRPSGNMMWGDMGVPVCGKVCECVEGGVLPCAETGHHSVTTWSLHIAAIVH